MLVVQGEHAKLHGASAVRVPRFPHVLRHVAKQTRFVRAAGACEVYEGFLDDEGSYCC
jgi:hypothetical protein